MWRLHPWAWPFTLLVYLAEDLLFTGPDGNLGTKAQNLAAHGSGTVRFRGHEPEELPG